MGKKHTLKFSYESWALEFQKWFEKQTYEKRKCRTLGIKGVL